MVKLERVSLDFIAQDFAFWQCDVDCLGGIIYVVINFREVDTCFDDNIIAEDGLALRKRNFNTKQISCVFCYIDFCNIGRLSSKFSNVFKAKFCGF